MPDALTIGVEAAMRDAAMRAILPRFRDLAAHEVIEKSAGDVVTVADHEAEMILEERLAALLPEAAIVGEEAAHGDPSVLERLDGSLCWIIDPVDGTNNFAEGKPPFGVLVALADKGQAIRGWILDCATGRFCHAEAGKGAFINGERITARTSGENPPVAAISLLYLDEQGREQMRRYISPHYRLVEIPRCAAEQYPRLALGQNDVSVFNRTFAWDHAAGVLFLEEAGGKAARLDGSPYRVDEPGRTGLIAAATPALWDGLAARIAAIPSA